MHDFTNVAQTFVCLFAFIVPPDDQCQNSFRPLSGHTKVGVASCRIFLPELIPNAPLAAASLLHATCQFLLYLIKQSAHSFTRFAQKIKAKKTLAYIEIFRCGSISSTCPHHSVSRLVGDTLRFPISWCLWTLKSVPRL